MGPNVRIEKDAIVNAVYDGEGTLIQAWVTMLDDEHIMDNDTDAELGEESRPDTLPWFNVVDKAVHDGQVV